MPNTDNKQQIEQHKGRGELISHLIVFQIKLILDGLRDAVLIPTSLVAGLAGILLNKKDPWVWYREILIWGRATDQWIDLFDAYKDVPPPDLEDLAVQTRERLEADARADKSPDSDQSDEATN